MLTSCSVGGTIEDQTGGLGPVGARTLNKHLAFFNADSYVYYAVASDFEDLWPLIKALTISQEVFWSVTCSKDFGDPVPGVDDADPACGNQACSG